jgi:type IV pilus assembly protein PilX
MSHLECNSHQPVRRQRGAALFISLLLLTVLTLIGLSAANVGILQERMASNFAQTNLAFQRAEATLRGVEQRVESLSKGGSGGLGEIPIWAEKVAPDGLDIERGDCAMSGAKVADWGWTSSPDFDQHDEKYVIVELSGATESGEVFGSACRPMQSQHAGNPGQSAVYYLVAARAEGNDGTEAVVQSIYYYP